MDISWDPLAYACALGRSTMVYGMSQRVFHAYPLLDSTDRDPRIAALQRGVSDRQPIFDHASRPNNQPTLPSPRSQVSNLSPDSIHTTIKPRLIPSQHPTQIALIPPCIGLQIPLTFSFVLITFFDPTLTFFFPLLASRNCTLSQISCFV